MEGSRAQHESMRKAHMERRLIGLTLSVLLLGGCGYNSVIDADEDVKAAFAEVQNQYKRRADLVPQLVKVVKGAKEFEQETLTAVVNARSKVGTMQVDAKTLDNPGALQQFEAAQGELGRALSRLMMVSERYPELKATAAFRDLQSQLEGTENRIAVARKRYIDSVSAYNKIVLRFPSSIGASLRGKSTRETFQGDPANEKAPDINF